MLVLVVIRMACYRQLGTYLRHLLTLTSQEKNIYLWHYKSFWWYWVHCCRVLMHLYKCRNWGMMGAFNPLATNPAISKIYIYIFCHQNIFFCPKKCFIFFGEKLFFWATNYFWWKKITKTKNKTTTEKCPVARGLIISFGFQLFVYIR